MLYVTVTCRDLFSKAALSVDSHIASIIPFPFFCLFVCLFVCLFFGYSDETFQGVLRWGSLSVALNIELH